VEKCGCTPDNNTKIKPGATLCGIKLGSSAKIDVRGSLFFDFVDCEDNQPLSLANLPNAPRDLYFQVSVPINVNPANPNSAGFMKTIDEVSKLTSDASCGGTTPCEVKITAPIPFSLVSASTRDEYFLVNNKELTADVFNSLSKAEQYRLVMPSGYARGWYDALTQKLRITVQDWSQFFPIDADVLAAKTRSSNPYFTLPEILSDESFQDIPAYVYAGGLVDMHYHVNISGLVYVPQAIELEQKGLKVNKHSVEHDEDDDDKFEHEHEGDKDYDVEEYKYSQYSSDGYSADKDSAYSMSRSYSSDNGDDETSDSKSFSDSNYTVKSCKTKTTYRPALQYIAGAIIVRDAFYIEASNGATLISNDPDTYSTIALDEGSGLAGRFQAFNMTGTAGGTGGNNGGTGSGGGNNNGGNGGGSGGGNNGGGSGGQSGGPGTGLEWIEIRPL
jgi:hypothetical protein